MNRLFPTISVCLLLSSSSCTHAPFFDNSTDADSAEEAQAQVQRAISSALDEGQITLGMPMKDVRGVWGSPVRIETAGDPGRGNQKWVYYTGISSLEEQPDRTVYFENGRVVGWDRSR